MQDLRLNYLFSIAKCGNNVYTVCKQIGQGFDPHREMEA